MKRTITLLLVMLMLTGLSAWAADGDVFTAKTVEGVEMTFKVISESKKTCQVWGGSSSAPPFAIDKSTTGSVTIPASVTADSGSSYSVTMIGTYAFYTCSGLVSIDIPSSVRSIGSMAFRYCSGLTSITIPNSVTTIGNAAFQSCSGLTTLSVETGNSVYDSRDNCNAIIHTGTNELIVGCQNTVIPNSVTSIGDYAFFGCSGLTSLTIPNGVTSIGNSAISSCTGLTSLIIPSSVTSIDDYAFSGSSGLTSITIPNSVTNIGNYAFWGCSGLTSLTIPDKLTSIGNEVFSGCSSLTSITIPNSVTNIGSYAFYGCRGLTSITIPNSVTSIGECAFYMCTGLNEVMSEIIEPFAIPNNTFSNYNKPLYVPEGTKALYQAVDGWKNFFNIVEAEGVGLKDGDVFTAKTVEGVEMTFKVISAKDKTCQVGTGELCIDKSTAGSVTIPAIAKGFKVVNISFHAFYECSNVVELSLPSSLIQIERASFMSSGIKSITIPKSVTKLGGGTMFAYCSNLEQITVETGNSVYHSQGNAIIETATNTLVAGSKYTAIPQYVTTLAEECFFGSGLSSLVIPEGVKIISDGAFYYNYYLEEITLPQSLESIANNVFCYCSVLKSLTIPAGVTSLGKIIYGCPKLTELKVSEDNPVYDSRNGCNAIIETATNTLVIACNTSVIPQGVEVIGNSAFAGTNIQSIEIPEDVTKISNYSFQSCKKLTTVSMPSSLQSLGYSAFSNCSILDNISIKVRTPFVISDKVFSEGTYNNAVLYVPAGTKTLYEQTDGWNNFKNIVEMNDDVFTAKTKEGVTMTFKILSREDMTCQVGNGEEASVDVATSGQVTIPEVANGYKVTAIGDKGFYNCSKLTHIWLHEGIERIGKLAFYGCTSLRVLDIPHSIVYISDDAFEGCTNLTVGIPSDFVGSLPYNPSPGSGVVIVITPPSETPAQLYELERIYIPRAVVGIDERSFSNCKSVKVMEVDAENTVFDSRENCNAIIRTADNTLLFGCQNTVIPETVTAIDSYAFEGHSNLKTITIPQNVASIGESAFIGCTALTAITSNIGVPFAINDNTFSEDTYRNATLTVPAGTKALYQATDGWKNFFNIVEAEGAGLKDGDVFTAMTVEGVEMTFKVISAKDKTCQVGTGLSSESCIDKSTAGSVTIPAIAKGFKVTTIASWALFRCYNITELTISEGIERLNSNSIEQCNGITSIILPASVTNLSVTFGNFSVNLKTIQVAEGNPKYDSRDNCNAIIETATNTLCSGCSTTVIPSSVTSIGAWSMSNKGMQSIRIPQSITSIGEGALRYNYFKEITIPASVKKIGSSAFSTCWYLEKVTILSKQLNWGSEAFGSCSKLREVVSFVENPTSSGGWLFYNYYDKEKNEYVMHDDAVLYVPAGTKSLYEQTGGWNNFKNIVELDNTTTDLSDASCLNANGEMITDDHGEVYDLDGRKVQTPKRGHLYIRGGKKFMAK